MLNKKLLDYVQKSLEGGRSSKQISDTLLKREWNIAEINKALLEAQKNIKQKTDALVPPEASSEKSDWNIEIKHLSASQILLYLGGLIVVIAGIVYITTSWSQWGALAHVFAIFLPMIVCYIIGAPMWFSDGRNKQGIVFILVGSLLFPFFLSVAFKELELFAQPFSDSFGLTVSFLTLVLYIGLNFIFRFPIWAFLYQAAGLVVYYYFWKVLGIEKGFGDPALAWLFLIPGTVYLVSSLLYDRNKRKDEAGFSYMLGGLVLLFSFFRLFVETLETGSLSWALVAFGFGYFGLGAWMEARGIKKYCSIPYFIGTGLVFFSFLRLGLEGDLLKDFTGSFGSNHDITGWSNVIIGIVYLAIAWFMPMLKKIRIEKGMIFKDFFNIAGTFFVLGGIFYLGLDGEKPIYETLLLLSSFGFIFGSIPKVSKQFLYIGTLFLIVYIFSIGGEYFKNNIGWPITLFVAGLISMGIGVLSERVRRKYFASAKP